MKHLNLACLAFVLILTGCASTHRLNSARHVAALTSSFSSACQQAGGAVGKPVAQGSEALCITQPGTKVDMYVNAQFILIQGEATADLLPKHFKGCAQHNGSKARKHVISGNRLIDISKGQDKCSTTTWNASHEFVDAGEKRYSRAFVSFPRDEEGNVDESNWKLAFTFY